MDIGREMRVIEVVEDTPIEIAEVPVPAALLKFDARKVVPQPPKQGEPADRPAS